MSLNVLTEMEKQNSFNQIQGLLEVGHKIRIIRSVNYLFTTILFITVRDLTYAF